MLGSLDALMKLSAVVSAATDTKWQQILNHKSNRRKQCIFGPTNNRHACSLWQKLARKNLLIGYWIPLNTSQLASRSAHTQNRLDFSRESLSTPRHFHVVPCAELKAKHHVNETQFSKLRPSWLQTQVMGLLFKWLITHAIIDDGQLKATTTMSYVKHFAETMPGTADMSSNFAIY